MGAFSKMLPRFVGVRGAFKVATRSKLHPAVLRELERREGSRNDSLLYSISFGIVMIGVSFLSVPLYRLFCQETGIGADPKLRRQTATDKIRNLVPQPDKEITVRFVTNVSRSLRWKFTPTQDTIRVIPGETALAFFTAKNLTERAIIGVSTYNINPYTAAQYFNKIQCFCFEEQRLNADEEVDMPVFFYIDPDYLSDPSLAFVEDIVLSYTFFESRGGINLAGLSGPSAGLQVKERAQIPTPFG